MHAEGSFYRIFSSKSNILHEAENFACVLKQIFAIFACVLKQIFAIFACVLKQIIVKIFA
jgi:hypothetical protein